MTFYADLHVHSKYSRATSKTCDLENLTYWAQKKGIAVVGTGDFTHPAWRREIADKLVPAEPGLFRLRDDLQRTVNDRLNPACRGLTRFMLSVEISTIYKKGEKTRKIHHLVYAPDLASVEAMVARLSKIGNLHSDGRPILGLDSRDLLEIVLESGPHSYLVPAHAWTPWFAVLGSKSGFDRITTCYGDLADHIFAIETGLSSDPEMNWRLSQLDRYALVSNSDAHSPAKLGREACRFDCDLDYFAMRRALETRTGFGGTVEFFPEEGKYHLDGHRKCGVVFEPDETRRHHGLCPVCGKPLTVGVMHRVQELADRPAGFRPQGASPYRCLIPLPEVISELTGTGPATKTVARNYEELLARLGDEFFILEHAPIEDLARQGSPQIAEAVARMRAGKVIRQPGFDGEYGVIRVFEDGEINPDRRASVALTLPGMADTRPAPAKKNTRKSAAHRGATARPETRPASDDDPEPETRPASDDDPEPETRPASDNDPGPEPHPGPDEPGNRLGIYLAGLDADQRVAAAMTEGPLLIVAGPGTGKTRTLTHRIAHIIFERGAAPASCLAITFTNRAAEEMRERLAALVPDQGANVPVMTFHALALSILREHRERCGLHRGFRVATDDERAALLAAAMDITQDKARRLLPAMSTAKRTRRAPDPSSELARTLDIYATVLDTQSLIDFDDLLLKATELLAGDADVRASYRARYQWISIDEYQDIDELQYQLVQLICPPGGNLCAIGDPDQAIYGFRGADVGFFMRFQVDHPGAGMVQLTRNYRSSSTIVMAALQAIMPASLVKERRLIAHAPNRGASHIEVVDTATERAEAEFVVHTIEQLVGGTSFFSMDSGRVGGPGHTDTSFADFAVLYRTDAHAGSLSEAFARSGIPFQKRSHTRLADQPGVAALLEAMTGHTGSESLLSRLHSAAADLYAVVAPRSEEARLITAAVDMLAPLAERCGQDSAQFVSELACGVEVDTWDPRADRVSLLTLHAAKGLEFRVVFLVGCEDGIIPMHWGKRDPAAEDEERRLFFVGVTRARDVLYLTRARRRMRQGKVRETEICPFIDDIENALLNETRVETRKKSALVTHEQLGLF